MSTMESKAQSNDISTSAGSFQNPPDPDFTDQAGQDAADRQKEIYQKTKILKVYLPGLLEVRRRVSIIIQQFNEIETVPSTGSVNDIFKQSFGTETSELETKATSGMKRKRFEPSHVLLEEIREINQHMIDVVVDISDESIDPNEIIHGVKGSEATILKCSYNPPALGPYLKTQYASSQSSVLAFRLLVPPNYPNSSPIFLAVLPVELSKDCKDLSWAAWACCRKSLQELPQPMSLTDIARSWGNWARVVIAKNATASMERYRFEPNHVLLEEIVEINQHMTDVVVGISDESIDPNEIIHGVKGSEATILKCSFNSPALSSYLKTQYASAQSSVLAFRLLVPPNYPTSSPIFLGMLPDGLSDECERLSRMARLRCIRTLRELPQPISLTDIARTWEDWGRAVIADRALEKGGRFSSRYGTSQAQDLSSSVESS